MEAIIKKNDITEVLKNSIFDALAIITIYFVPVISHLTTLPVYFIEPMRLLIVLAIVHTSRNNAYILALTLPLFSFIVSAHPVFIKSLLITGELVFMTWTFFFFANKMKNKFSAMFLSIGLSKIVYYSFKYVLLSAVLIEGNLLSTPILIQIITTIFFSSYIFLLRK